MTTTIFPQLPLIVLPDFVTELATITPMYSGTPADGGGLLPGAVVNLVPQTFAGLVFGSVVTTDANPLNESGAVPPVRLFSADHSSLHQVTVVVGPAAATVELPSTNAPRLANEKTTAVLPVSDDGK